METLSKRHQTPTLLSLWFYDDDGAQLLSSELVVGNLNAVYIISGILKQECG